MIVSNPKTKKLPIAIRAYNLAAKLLEMGQETFSEEGRHILGKLLDAKQKAERKLERPAPSTREKEWIRARDRADESFSLYIRYRDTAGGVLVDERYGTCVTCGNPKHYRELQCGHWLVRAKMGTRFETRNAHGQCAGCNNKAWGGGRATDHERYIIETYGVAERDRLVRLSKFNTRDQSTEELKEIADRFDILLVELKAAA